MEYLQVFDENRNMLNEKISRNEKDSLPVDKYYMIILIFIENSQGKFLLQRTSKKKHSVIATTGGHVTYKDDGPTTVIKEVKEELGLDLDLKDIQYIDTVNDGYCLAEVYYLKKDIDLNSIILQEEEVESVAWYSIDEINSFISNNEFRKSNIEPFKKVRQYIKTSK